MSDWFFEKDEGRLQFGYKTKKTLFHETSPFQDVKVLETEAYGKMLVIDNFVMITETDEFVYHEMITHPPLCYYKGTPKKVLVIGGGDGGTVREVLKHSSVEKVVLCEIDKLVVEASKKFFPQVSGELDNPRAEVLIGDGIEYVKQHKNEFDIILVDSTDPIGPGEGLFTKDFYKSVREALVPGGIVALQSESPWYEPDLLRRIQANVGSAFSHSRAYMGPVPTYPRGLWSWTMASENPENLRNPSLEKFSVFEESLSFLTKSQLSNLFDIPPFFKKKLKLP